MPAGKRRLDKKLYAARAGESESLKIAGGNLSCRQAKEDQKNKLYAGNGFFEQVHLAALGKAGKAAVSLQQLNNGFRNFGAHNQFVH